MNQVTPISTSLRHEHAYARQSAPYPVFPQASMRRNPDFCDATVTQRTVGK